MDGEINKLDAASVDKRYISSYVNTVNGGTLIRRVKIGARSHELVERYRKFYSLTLQELYGKIILDWRERYGSGDMSQVWNQMLENHVQKTPDKYEPRSVAFYVNDYIYIYDIAKNYFGCLTRFFPYLVEDWVENCLKTCYAYKSGKLRKPQK